jgi:hypothetical protein
VLRIIERKVKILDREDGRPVAREYRHGKCGGVVVGAERVTDEEDCPICAEVRTAFHQYGVIRASAGTPLAAELGLEVLAGKPGIVTSAEC